MPRHSYILFDQLKVLWDSQIVSDYVFKECDLSWLGYCLIEYRTLHEIGLFPQDSYGIIPGYITDK